MTIKKQPQIRFGGFGGDWVEKKIIELASNQKLSNGVFNNPENVGSGYKLINVLDMYSEGFIQENKLSLLELSKVEFENNQVKNGDIFFTRSSLVKTGIAFSNIYLGNSDDVTFDGHLIKLSPDLDRYYSEFLHFSLKNQKVREQFIRSAKTTTMTTIGQAEIANTVVSLPEKPEQIAIGQFFRQLDEMLTLAEQKHAQTVQLKKALLGKLFPISGSLKPQIRLKGFSGDWVERKLGDLGEIVMGQSPDSANYTDNPNDMILVQGNADLKNGKVVPRVWTTQITKTAKKGSLLISVRAPVGDVGKTDFDIVIGRGISAIQGNEFIYQTLVKMKLDNYWTSVSAGSTFESINGDDIKNAVILCPNIAEQTAIGKLFQTLDYTIALQAQEIAQIKQLKSALLGKMFV